MCCIHGNVLCVGEGEPSVLYTHDNVLCVGEDEPSVLYT